jgi:hypothetical protein
MCLMIVVAGIVRNVIGSQWYTSLQRMSSVYSIGAGIAPLVERLSLVWAARLLGPGPQR